MIAVESGVVVTVVFGDIRVVRAPICTAKVSSNPMIPVREALMPPLPEKST